jgi:cell division protein FtsI (penicillin-binding protein 3)
MTTRSGGRRTPSPLPPSGRRRSPISLGGGGGDRIRVPTVAPPVPPTTDVLKRARSRTSLLATLVVVALGAIGVRAASLCVVPSDVTLDRGNSQRWEQMILRARRGALLDRDGDPLVVSVDTPTVVVDPELAQELLEHERHALARRAAHLLDLSVDEVLDKMAKPGRYARLATKVHPKVATDIQDIGSRVFFVEADQRRYYAEGALAGHVLGFVDGAGEGRTGLEASLDPWLRGSTALMQRRRDRHGLDVDRLRDIDRIRTAGMDVHLTLDRRIQHITERALEGVMERSKPAAAMAVVLDPRTGDVLALANTPVYNPNALPDDQGLMRNRAVLDEFEPGSVLKPFVAAAALEEGKVQLDTLIDCENGRWSVGRSRIGDDHPHGRITVSEVIKYSSNIGSAKLAFLLGAPTYLDYLERFGFGVPTGIELPHERDGRVRSAATIKPIELATTSYGHGMTATALQIASAMATLANDGVRMRPRLVTRVVDEDGVPVVIHEPEVLDRVISPSTARAITEAMVTVTEQGGTATRARVPGHRVAGKTGTAWKHENGRYTDGRIGSFVGFVPADDPKLAIVVVVDDVRQGSRYGGIAAAPAFAEIASQSLRVMGVAPDPAHLPTKPAARRDRPAPAPAPAVDAASEPLAFVDGGWRVPDLTGRSAREALASLQGADLRIELTGSGRVAAIEPAPGTPVPPGSPLRIILR